MRLLKCQWCCEIDTKENLIKKNMYYHEKCLIEVEKFKEAKRITFEQMKSFIKVIMKVHELENEVFIPKGFHQIVAQTKQKYNDSNFYLDLIQGYSYCSEKITFARKNKQFNTTEGELKYCFQIVINCLLDAKQNKQLMTKEDELTFSNEIKEMVKQYNIESPIEERLVIGLLSASSKYIEIQTQQKYAINNRNYRVDILINITDKNNNIKQYVIECDGHDFHEKTKEQATRDKQRDRDFLSIGIPTIRFSGTEIWNNTKECVDEILLLASI